MASRKRYTTSKATKKALKTRGGFVPAGFGNRILNNKDLQKIARDRIFDPSKITNPLYMAGKFTEINEFYKKATDVTKGKTRVTRVDTGRNDTGKAANHGTFPAIETDSERTVGNSAVQQIRELHTKVQLGRRTTSSLNMARKLNGGTKYRFADTMLDNQDATDNVRQALRQGFGFNQKMWMIFKDLTQLTYNDYNSIFQIASLTSPNQDQETPYGATLKEHTMLRIANGSSYFPVKVNIHVFQANDITDPPETLFNTMTSDLVGGVQEQGAIPILKQFSDVVSDSAHLRTTVDPLVTWKASDEFERKVTHIKSFGRKIRPGDVWKVDVTTQCGPGVNLAVLKEASLPTLSGNSVPNFFYMIEAHGYQCEGVSLPEQASFIGTSPGWINMEARKEMEYVPFSSSIDVDADDGGTNTLSGLVRVFKTRESAATRRVNVPVSDIGDPSDVTKTFYIPVQTASLPSYAEELSEKVDSDAARARSRANVFNALSPTE